MSEDNSTAEEWRPVPGFAHYKVSSAGRVRSLDRMVRGKPRNDGAHSYRLTRGRVLKPNIVQGYAQYSLSASSVPRYRKGHHLVLMAFVGPRPEGQECRHLNGVRDDNRVENLRWGTKAENMADKNAHGTVWRQRGELCPTSKLTWPQVRGIRAGSMNDTETAKAYGVSRSNISQIRRGVTWKEQL